MNWADGIRRHYVNIGYNNGGVWHWEEVTFYGDATHAVLERVARAARVEILHCGIDFDNCPVCAALRAACAEGAKVRMAPQEAMGWPVHW